MPPPSPNILHLNHLLAAQTRTQTCVTSSASRGSQRCPIPSQPGERRPSPYPSPASRTEKRTPDAAPPPPTRCLVSHCLTSAPPLQIALPQTRRTAPRPSGAEQMIGREIDFLATSPALVSGCSLGLVPTPDPSATLSCRCPRICLLSGGKRLKRTTLLSVLEQEALVRQALKFGITEGRRCGDPAE